MKAKKKRGVDVPLKVRAFINSVTGLSLENMETPLARFSWDYEKGDFYHWVDLMNQFDSYFESYIRPRKDLQLEGDFDDAVPGFPKEAILQILRVTRIILENCINKHCYSSYEHLSSLLASTDTDIVTASLQTLAAFVKKPLQSNRAVRWHGDQVLNTRLFSLSQGWGGKEEGLGLLACAIENGCDSDALMLGSTLHVEFYSDASAEWDHEEKDSKTSGLKMIHKPDLYMRHESDLQLLKELVDHYKVPPNLRFSLLTRLRLARSFPDLHIRRKYLCIRLLAFTVLLQSNPNHEDLSAFFGNEPEFVNELVALLRCEDSVPEDIRLLAVLALATQSQDRPRQSSVLNAITAGGHRGILPSLMQKAVGSVMGADSSCSVSFVEALLFLVTVLVSSSSGCAALRESGLIPALLPLLKDMNPFHTHLVSSGVHILEAFMDYSNPAGTLFRDLGGLDDAVERLKFEISRVEEGANRRQDGSLSLEKGKMPAVDNVNGQQTVAIQSEALIPFQQRLLLKVLLRAIALGTYAPGNAARIHSSEESALPSCLCTVFRHAKEFGGGVFSLAASVMSDLIHKDPTCFSALDAAGLPVAFLDAITSGVLPSSEAVSCIPHSLDALCLNNSGLQAVKDRNALSCFVKIFTSKPYLRALANETPGSLATNLDELMRHAPSLRGPGVDTCIDILKTIAVIGGFSDAASVSSTYEEVDTDAPVPMETDSDLQMQQQADVASTENPGGNVEAYLLEYVNNTARLLETLLQNADTSRVFIEKKGIEALLKLYSLPNLPVSFGGSSVAQTFRAFSPQHANTLARAVCGALRERLSATLEVMKPLASTKLSDMENTDHAKLIRCLVATEMFLSLSSVLVRSTNTMMTELSTGGADVLLDVGKVHREVLWQISLLDDAKAESKKEEVPSMAAAVNPPGAGARESEDEPGVFPTVRYVNPVSIRDSPSSHWGVEPDFFPTITAVERLHHRTRREHGASSDFFPQVGRLGRLAHHTEAPQVDLEGSPNAGEGSQSQEPVKRKSPDSLNYEMMTRLVLSARGLYMALGKAMVVPSRRREDIVAPDSTAKAVAATVAKLLRDSLSFEGGCGSSQLEASKCRYRGKVTDDIFAIVFDSRRHTCNTLLVNNLYAHGALGQLLDSFTATSQLFWTVLRPSAVPMESENCTVEVAISENGSEKHAWLFETSRSYGKLIEHLVTSALLLSSQPTAQLLVHQVAGGLVPIPRDPEALVQRIQLQVLEAILPIWNHPMFAKCSPNFIASLAAIIAQIYTGVGDVKSQRNAGASARLLGPPPDEGSISTIVEMGFSRERAEEALRQVMTNNVEMAMDWLCSHPEEPQEDDELARALALSLGSTDTPTDADASKGKEITSGEDILKAPPVEDMLASCISLLQSTDAVAFPITDLLVTMCNRNKGQHRIRVVSYLIHQLKVPQVDGSDSDFGLISTISHTFALVLNEDSASREIAAEHGLVGIALAILSTFNPKVISEALPAVPKWATALLLVLDHMLQYKPKVLQDQQEPAATTSNNAASGLGSLSDDQKPEMEEHVKDTEDPFVAVLGKSTGFMTENEQHRAMTIACNFLVAHIPATTVQAVLQLCARLTKTHSVAMQFLESGGLTAILNLPRQSLFPGFDSVAAIIIRHLLEDPQTLQQAMELEIRHTVMAALHRHNGRVSPRLFLTALAPVVSRNPAIFMQASAAVCQLENVGGRPHIMLSKEKEKEKERDRDKPKDEKEKEKEKEKSKAWAPGLPNEPSPGFTSSPCCDGSLKAHDVSSKSTKGHHKKVPHSFSQVIDQLLEVVLNSPPPGKDGNNQDSGTAMEVEDSNCNDKGKAKLDKSTVLSQGNLSEASAGLAKVAFILKLMMEILLMYSGAVGVVLRRDLESSQGRGPSQAGSEMIGHGGLLYHILQRLLPYPLEKVAEKLNEDEWREKLSDKAAYFLMAVCVRSGEGRRRVVSEISRTLSVIAHNAQKGGVKTLQPPGRKMRSFVALVNLILSAHSSTNAQAPGFSTDVAKTMVDAGLIQSLTSTLQVIDLDHPEASKLVTAVLKALEALTRAATTGDQFYGGTNLKKAVADQPLGPGAPVTERQPSDVSQHGGGLSTPSRNRLVSDPDFPDMRMAEGSMLGVARNNNSRDNNMEPDLRIGTDMTDGVHMEPEAAVFMHGSSGNVPSRGDTATAEITFRVEHRSENAQDEEDEDMDGDDGEEEEEEDDEDEDDMEGGEGVPHLSPPDTDVEDHEDNGLGDDYGEDMVEEEDEDDDWQDNRVIEVRWRDGLPRFNHVQVLGHSGSAALVDFPGDPFQGMNEIYSSFLRPTVVDRRRPAAGYRAFPERSGGDRGGAFHHPLLLRPTSSTSTAGAGNSAMWTSAGSMTRDTEALLGGGGFDVTPFYMYDPVLAEHSGDRLFGERGVSGAPPPLLDFSMDPGYLTGRRVGRSDGRLSSWTDDGQPQAGADAAAIAHGIEDQFISRLRSLIPVEEPVPDQVDNASAAAEEAEQPGATGNMEGVEPEMVVRMAENPQDAAAHENAADEQNQTEPQRDLARNSPVVEVQSNVLDIQMEDERSASVLRDPEVGGQESSAMLGENLRHLEVEIGSADGRDNNDGHIGPERLIGSEMVNTAMEVAIPGQGETSNRQGHGGADEEMPNQHIEEAAAYTRSPMSRNDVGVSEYQERDGTARQDEDDSRHGGGHEVNTIDPTFLEALPEYLRAEVLASHETQNTRVANVPPPPPPTEDIDPEFLAALPPDIQAEVLAQQRAQRLIQAQQVEGQPVDMDSASIIATFPAELREEVLLTSSEQVLAALPPSLLAEAQLLRERAMNQYQSRGLLGGANRIGIRRNNIGIGSGGPSAMNQGVGSIGGFSMVRRPGTLANGGIKMKEVEGKPFVDTAGLESMLRLLRLAQPLGKGLLPRLLLNLCAHSVTRANLVRLLLDMLRPELKGFTASPFLGDHEMSQRLYGCEWNVVYARSQVSYGVPPLVSKHVLEILTHLGKHHEAGADLLTYLEPAGTDFDSSQKQFEGNEKGKAKLVDGVVCAKVADSHMKGEIPLILLLKLLNQPLYSRSSAHLEQLMGLFEVITSHLGSKCDSISPSEGKENLAKVCSENRAVEANLSSSDVPGTSNQESNIEQSQSSIERATSEAEPSRPVIQSGGSEDHEIPEPSTSETGQKMDIAAILSSLPEPELCKLCRFLVQEGLSDTAYNRVAEVLKKLANIAPAHRWLFISELADAARGLSCSAIAELCILGNTETMVLSTGTMAGAAVLRVLQCLSTLTAEGNLAEKDDTPDQGEGSTTVRDLSMALEPLWQGLSACIAKVESRLGNTGTSSGITIAATAGGNTGVASPLPLGAQSILPFVEAFFVLCEKLRLGLAQSVHPEPCTATAREIKEAASSSTLTVTASVAKMFPGVQKRSEGDMTFLRFADKHRRMLNAFVRQNPALLEKSLSLLLKMPRLIDFDNKRAYFRARIRQQHEQQHHAPLRICVRRNYVLEDSYNQLRIRKTEELQGRLTVQFQAEEGIDAGGLTREWYQQLSRVIFDKGALLFTTVGNESTFQPNPNSVFQTEHLSYFKFVGRVVAKALFDGQLLDVYFTRSFYKHILGVKVTYHDIEAVDPDYYKNLKWMLENDISDVVGVFFSVDADEEKHILYEKTEVTDIELIPGGRNVRVTEENKHEYVDLNAEHKLTTAIRPQINAFLEGFNELINRDLISIFNDKELELLISGLPEIELDDLKANTEYTGYTAASPVVHWFWEVVRAFNKEDMARLLQFITGTSKVPLEGFRALQGISGPQKCQIHKAYGVPERLPTAHTCFNQLDLPEYSSKEQLQERLLLAIHEANEGFGFG